MIRLVVGLFILALTAIDCFAEHLPEHLLARGRPETALARINLETTSIEKIIRLYGKPTEEKKWEPGLPNSAGQIDYYWRRRGLNLHVQIEFIDKDPNWKPVVFVEVGMGTTRRIGATRAGLVLGDSLSKLQAVYGRRFVLRNIPKRNIHDVMVQWRREEYSLVATLDNRNRITSLSLSAPE